MPLNIKHIKPGDLLMDAVGGEVYGLGGKEILLAPKDTLLVKAVHEQCPCHDCRSGVSSLQLFIMSHREDMYWHVVDGCMLHPDLRRAKPA